jgi:hypothetical protein
MALPLGTLPCLMTHRVLMSAKTPCSRNSYLTRKGIFVLLDLTIMRHRDCFGRHWLQAVCGASWSRSILIRGDRKMAAGPSLCAVGVVHNFQSAGGISAKGELALSESASNPDVAEAVTIRTPYIADRSRHCRRLQCTIGDGFRDVKGVGGHEVGQGAMK